ncbi:MAG: CoA transferase [Deltaproteobacteria bacterium]|nr:CoA transferase [Deltaproteobacteria bacterium]
MSTNRADLKNAGFLAGIRVLELADERGEFAGKVLATLGADVVKIEPPRGSPSRQIGPFYRDLPDPERSLFFWHYNVGKRGIALDLDDAEGLAEFRRLAGSADVILESAAPGRFDDLGADYEQLRKENPGLIWASITPFGPNGPWRDLKACDLVHLALGGQMNYTRYPGKIDGSQDTPPIAPQMWQAYHLAGDHAAIGVLAALHHRMSTGEGQRIDISIHQVCSVTTEMDVPTWIYNKAAIPSFGFRYTPTRDGRYMLAGLQVPGMGMGTGASFDALVDVLKKHGGAADLTDEKFRDPAVQAAEANHIQEVTRELVMTTNMEDVWNDAQQRGQMWAPIRKPEENLDDPNWNARSTFGTIEHPDVAAAYRYPTGRWDCEEVPSRIGPRAPHLGEHSEQIRREAETRTQRTFHARPVAATPGYENRSGRQLPLEGVRVLDLTWLLASAGGPKIFSSLGAECIRVEWRDRLDMLRSFPAVVPDDHTDAGQFPRNINRGGYFNDTNAGRRGISLNMNEERGREIFKKLVEISDIVVEGFTATRMERWGFGYEGLRAIKPDIVYVQQSGMGRKGPYHDYRSVGPIAQAITGITELSGLPETWPPCGWLYSYLDFVGAYNCTLAMLTGLYHRRRTGKGIYIDSSQLEPGIYYTGTAILDAQVNSRAYRRTGNRSPNIAAAPHGAYPCDGPEVAGIGRDRWIAIACMQETEWEALIEVLGAPDWALDARFATLAERIRHADALDAALASSTGSWDAWELMGALQAVGVSAGVCQTAEERVERDPQLAHLGWLTELPHREIGRFPVKDLPMQFSETPAYQGGPTDRASPCYGEDNAYVYGELLGLSQDEIRQLEKEAIV